MPGTYFEGPISDTSVLKPIDLWSKSLQQAMLAVYGDQTFTQLFYSLCWATNGFHVLLRRRKNLRMRRDVFQAIADPTRREILHMLAHKPLNVNAVSSNFDVSRTAVYKHVKILAECGLVVITQHGRERFCEARLDRLGEVSDWVEQYRQFWSARLDALDVYLTKLQTTSAPKKKTARKKRR